VTAQQIETKMSLLVRSERKITNEVLQHINLADQKKHYLERGFGSLFDWLTKGHGYSEGAAQRRIQAARLLRAVPHAAEKLESGEVNLNNLARAGAAIRAQEKAGTKLTSEEKAEVIEQMENKTGIEAQQILVGLFPDLKLEMQEPKKTVIDENTVRLAFNLPNEVLQDLERVKTLLSHVFPNGNWADVIGYVAKEFLQRKDPLLRRERKTVAMDFPADLTPSTAVAAKRCVKPIPYPLRRVIIKRARGQCEYIDPTSGRRCRNTFQLEIDHIHPRALGGGNEPENLRCLCRAHNQFVALNILEIKKPCWGEGVAGLYEQSI
jgi:hypothetical protein